ncbi:PQQ-binding-like beta-propeller repeat protein, partial [Persicitalea sp.]|uniref:outer membrane protein assembly factor BamB family protein n=1 Tax=Persicitalea sp. TaxID=3100273 RepID=UPI003593B19E
SNKTNGYSTQVGTTLYSVTYEGSNTVIKALDSATGAEKWRYSPTQKGESISLTSSISVSGNSLATMITLVSGVGTNPTYMLRIIDATTGKFRWETQLLGPALFPLVVGSKVYVADNDVIKTAFTRIKAFDVQMGVKIWESQQVRSTSPMCMISADGQGYYDPRSGMQQ